jgi:hypothetical protein
LYKAFAPMISAAKQLALKPNDKTAHSKWQQTNNEVRIIFIQKFRSYFS